MGVVGHQTFTHHDVDSAKVTFQPGDFIVTHGDGAIDWLIRFGTMSHWNHAALITSSDGSIIEALGKGLKKNTVEKYRQQDYHLIRLELNQVDQQQVVTFAEAMLKRHPRYGYLSIATIVLKILTKMRLVIKLDGTFICSEFVARSLAQGGVIWFKDTSLITPADLYNRFIVQRKDAS